MVAAGNDGTLAAGMVDVAVAPFAIGGVVGVGASIVVGNGAAVRAVGAPVAGIVDGKGAAVRAVGARAAGITDGAGGATAGVATPTSDAFCGIAARSTMK